MSNGKFFTITLTILSLVVLVVAILVFPTFIVKEGDSESVKNNGFADLWKENEIILPQLTEWAVAFTKAKNVRIIGIIILVAVSLVMEIFIKNRRMAGIYHLVTLVIGIIIGWLILLSIFLPYMPM